MELGQLIVAPHLLRTVQALVAAGYYAISYYDPQLASGPVAVGDVPIQLVIEENGCCLVVRPADKKPSVSWGGLDGKFALELPPCTVAFDAEANIILGSEQQGYLVFLAPRGRDKALALELLQELEIANLLDENGQIVEADLGPQVTPLLLTVPGVEVMARLSELVNGQCYQVHQVWYALDGLAPGVEVQIGFDSDGHSEWPRLHIYADGASWHFPYVVIDVLPARNGEIVVFGGVHGELGRPQRLLSISKPA